MLIKGCVDLRNRVITSPSLLRTCVNRKRKLAYFFYSFAYNLFVLLLGDILLLVIWLNGCFHLGDGFFLNL